jgi:hypothetical protein
VGAREAADAERRGEILGLAGLQARFAHAVRDILDPEGADVGVAVSIVFGSLEVDEQEAAAGFEDTREFGEAAANELARDVVQHEGAEGRVDRVVGQEQRLDAALVEFRLKF